MIPESWSGDERRTAPIDRRTGLPKPSGEPTYLSVGQLAQRWNVDRHTIHNLIKHRHLIAIQVGKQWRIAAVNVAAYEAAQATAPATDTAN